MLYTEKRFLSDELLDQIISGFFMHVFYVHKIVANKKCPRKKAPSFLSKVITKRDLLLLPASHDDLGLILQLINSVRRVKYQSRMCREQPNLCIIVVKLRTTF